jgi:hypothetical protein
VCRIPHEHEHDPTVVGVVGIAIRRLRVHCQSPVAALTIRKRGAFGGFYPRGVSPGFSEFFPSTNQAIHRGGATLYHVPKIKDSLSE